MQTYAEHYQRCREVSGIKSIKYNSVYDLSLDTEFMPTNKPYIELIHRIHRHVSQKINQESNCHYDTHAIRLKRYKDITDIDMLLNMICPQIERKVFGCYVSVDFVHIYRSRVTNKNADTSWLWHYDDCPKEFIKLMIYLNDVGEHNGCFRTLKDAEGKTPVIESFRVTPYEKIRKQIYKGSRIPQEAIDKYLNEGCEILDIVGSAGTYALITPNIPHCATIPEKKCKTPRDVMLLFIRPQMSRVNHYFNKRNWKFDSDANVKKYALD
tara:strand:+ start:1142 stop:1945 length:804 start_codon:yes stop_codon:yes gene_type:complete